MAVPMGFEPMLLD